MLDHAVAAGDDHLVRCIRQAMTAAEKRNLCRSSKLYADMVKRQATERQVNANAKRARLTEERQYVIRSADAKALSAINEREAQEAKRETLAATAAAELVRKNSLLPAAAAKQI